MRRDGREGEEGAALYAHPSSAGAVATMPARWLNRANLLNLAGIVRSAVRLLLHQDNRYTRYHSPYTLWRDNRDRFETSTGGALNGNRFTATKSLSGSSCSHKVIESIAKSSLIADPNTASRHL